MAKIVSLVILFLLVSTILALPERIIRSLNKGYNDEGKVKGIAEKDVDDSDSSDSSSSESKGCDVKKNDSDSDEDSNVKIDKGKKGTFNKKY